MKTLKITLAIITAGLMFSFTGCQKEAGTGGKAHIHGHTEHHGDHIEGVLVKIWYGKKSVANTSEDADNNTQTNHDGEFEFENLTRGNYFLHASYTSPGDGEKYEAGKSVKIEEKSQEVSVELELEHGH